jgi:hypothetical protein
MTVYCSETGCSNLVTVFPFGDRRSGIYVKAKCQECNVTIVLDVDTKEPQQFWEDDGEWDGFIAEDGGGLKHTEDQSIAEADTESQW